MSSLISWFDKSINNLSLPKVIILFFIIGLITYAKSLSNGFVGDDLSQILNNNAIRSLGNIPKFFTAGTFYNPVTQKLEGLYYKPLLTTYFSLIYSVASSHAFFYHLVQILLHVTNSILVYLLGLKFFNKRLSILLGLIFLVHPINSEAVLYISSAQEPLFLFFGMFAFLLTIKGKPEGRNFFLVILFLFISVLFKETGLLFSISILVYVYFFKKKYFLKFFLSIYVIFIIYLIMRASAVPIFKYNIGFSPISTLGLGRRLINIPFILFSYIKAFLFPVDLASNQTWVVKFISYDKFYRPLLIDILFFGLVILLGIYLWLKRRAEFRMYLLFVIVFFVSLGLHLQIIPLDSTFAERWFYSPTVGLLMLLGIVLEKGLGENKKIIFASFCLGIIMLVALGWRTATRSFDWKDEFTLFSQDVKVNKDSYIIEMGLGYAYAQKKDFDTAINHLERSTQIYPYVTNFTELGTAYSQRGDFVKAEESYKNALKIKDFYLTYENLASLYYGQLKDYEKAIEITKRGVSIYPSSSKLRFILALSYYKLNDMKNAQQTALECYNRIKDQNCYKLYYGIPNKIPLEGI